MPFSCVTIEEGILRSVMMVFISCTCAIWQKLRLLNFVASKTAIVWLACAIIA